MNSSTVAIIILVVTMLMFVTEIIPIPVTALCSAFAMGVFNVIPFKTAFSGFSNDITVMIIGSMIVGEALFETGFADSIGKTIIRRVGNNEKAFLAVCVCFSALLSAFLSNTAVVAMMLPVIAATAAKSDGRIRQKNVCMAVGFAANIGGGMTLVGSTPNMICQGLLVEAGLRGMNFFDLTLGSLPRFAFLIIFYLTIGYKLQQKYFDFDDSCCISCAAPVEEPAEEKSKRKMIISASILVLMVIGFISELWTVGAIALIAGLLCIITGCISLKSAFLRIDWGTIWVMAGSLGMAAGIDKSGAGSLIANSILGLFGGSISHMTLLLVFTFISIFLANIMSSSASAAILAPIAISISLSMGYDPIPVLLVIIWALNLAFLTPVATPPVTMTLQCGYRFLDYAKVGAPLLVGCLLLTVAVYPFLI